jgi:uncharacterized protein (TIGR02246 family)
MNAKTDGMAAARKLAAGLSLAWNRHDMAAFAALFHDNAAFVNVSGRYVRGPAQIERMHALAHAGPFRNSMIRMQVTDAAELTAGVVLAHLTSELEGDERAAGQVRHALMTVVIEQRAGEWKLTAAHNTNIVPPAG